jgi:general stress protein 26
MSGHIPWSKVSLWLQSRRSCWLCTARPDGRPHGAPIWFWWEEGTKSAYFVTGKDSVKGKNLVHQSYVSLLVGDGDDTIILNGRAIPVTDTAEQQRVNQAWGEKYVDPYSGAKADVLAPHDQLYRVPVQQVMAWEYGAVVSRTDWHFNS